MSTTKLTKDEKYIFVKELYDSSTRAMNAQVREEYGQKTGHTDRNFIDKMNAHRNFKELELDMILISYRNILGEQLYSIRYRENFGEYPQPLPHTEDTYNPADGDARTKANAAAFQTPDPARRTGMKSLQEHLAERGFFPQE
jgi:hypothetical protein